MHTESTSNWDPDVLDKLLKSELSAVETYQQAISKIREHDVSGRSGQIESIYQEHRQAADTLRNRITQLGGKPSEGSGLWGSWSKLVMGGAKLLGDEATLRALREGEESGVDDYREALEEEDVPQDVRSLIQNTLLPRQEAHIQILDRFIESTGSTTSSTSSGSTSSRSTPSGSSGSGSTSS